jgi:hypothetical protein
MVSQRQTAVLIPSSRLCRANVVQGGTVQAGAQPQLSQLASVKRTKQMRRCSPTFAVPARGKAQLTVA